MCVRERERERERDEIGDEFCPPRLTKLVRDLMQDEGDGGAHTQSEALADGCTESQAVCKVVQSITNNDEPGEGLDGQDPAHHPFPSLTSLLLVSQ